MQAEEFDYLFSTLEEYLAPLQQQLGAQTKVLQSILEILRDMNRGQCA